MDIIKHVVKEDTRSEVEVRMTEIERRHFNRCLWQAILAPNRTIMIECFSYPKAGPGQTAIVVKHYHKPIPRPGVSRPWPKATAAYVYLPVDDTNSWDGLEASLTAIEYKSACA